QPGVGVDAADTRLHLAELVGIDQVGLVEQDDVGERDLVLRLRRVLEAVLQPFGVGDRDHRVELGLAAATRAHDERLAHRRVVGRRMASKLLFLRISPSMMRTRSPRTVQQTQPLFISNTSSSAPTTRSLSMPISPNSLTMTAYFCPCGSDRIRLSSVVLPAPR